MLLSKVKQSLILSSFAFLWRGTGGGLVEKDLIGEGCYRNNACKLCVANDHFIKLHHRDVCFGKVLFE